ncbi:MAG: arsenite methyltransferase [Myxococcota bacterium]|jgi:arsenite methyltransferase
MTADATFWNNLADEYSRKPVQNPDAFERKIAITRDQMSADSVVLDIGCGTGSLALRLASAGAHIHGLDLSPEMVAIANRKAAADGVSNVTFHTGPFDASFTAFEPESLDGVCAYSLLHLVEDRPGMLKQIYRLVKPGGFFISSTVCLGDSWVPYGVVLRFMRWMGKAPMVAVIPGQAWVREVEAAGFVDVTACEVGAKSTTMFLVGRRPI